MRILRQILIILAVWLAGELASRFLHLPIPGNVLGMLFMLVLLITRVIKVKNIIGASTFFLDHLSFFFIPGSVALMVCYKQIGGQLFVAIASVVMSSILVFLVTGLSTEWLLRLIRRRKERKNADSGGTD
ncbi:MAG: CidA/LrgA family protein [Clostridia bacterium]